jgi:hypothetical protein
MLWRFLGAGHSSIDISVVNMWRGKEGELRNRSRRGRFQRIANMNLGE